MDYEGMYERERDERDRAEADFYAACEQAEADRAKLCEREATLAEERDSLAAEVAQLRAALAEAHALTAELQRQVEGQWISVEDRLPEVKRVVLLQIKNCKRAKEGYLTGQTDRRWRVWGGEYAFDAVVSWKYLPELPHAPHD